MPPAGLDFIHQSQRFTCYNIYAVVGPWLVRILQTLANSAVPELVDSVWLHVWRRSSLDHMEHIC